MFTDTHEDDKTQPAISPTSHSSASRRHIWGGRTFRLNLHNFRLNGGLSLRRFSVMEAAFILMLALLASRGLGIVRQSIFNALFGTGSEANAYYAASRLPDTLFNLIAGGALSHAFIPVFLSYEKEKGQLATWRLTSLVFNVLFVFLTLALLLAELIAPTFVSTLLVPGYSPAEQALTTQLTRVMLLQPLILGLGTIATAILNSKRQFVLPALAIAVNNLGLIAGILASLLFPQLGIYGPTYGVLFGAFLQVLVQLPGIWKQQFRYSWFFDLRDSGLHEVLHLLVPNALSIAVAYGSLILETYFTSFLPDLASLSALHNALMLEALPVALLSQAIGSALLPHLSLLATTGRFVRMRQVILKIMGMTILGALPLSLALALAGRPLIRILFQHGAFSAHSADLTYIALLGYAVAIPGVVAADLLGRGFFALKDARTPLLTNIFSLLARYFLILLLLRLFSGPQLVLAIPLSLAGSVSLEAVLLAALLLIQLRRRSSTDKGMLRLLRRRSSRSGSAF